MFRRLLLLRAVNVGRIIAAEYSEYSSEASFEVRPYKLHKLEKGPHNVVTVNKNEALDMYKQMSAIRRMENTCANLYQVKLIRGFCHLYAGQEAVAVGIRAAMKDDDTFITSYRSHAWDYMMNRNPYGVLAELLGKKTGSSRGKGGSMHTYGPRFFGGNGIVGAHVPLGTGLALYHKHRNDKAVSFTAYGDGAANQGQVFEAYNIAKLLHLPVVYICENNRYAMGTSTQRGAANTDFYTRGDYVPGFWADGMDVLAMHQAGKFARNHAAEGRGPIIIEAYTYRYFGHSMSDPGVSYRNREEIKGVREAHDPINTFRKKLLGCKLVEEGELDAVEEAVKKEIDATVEKAKGDVEPEMVELTSDVYSVNLGGKIRMPLYTSPGEHKRIGKAINLR